jgi:hypothetical protein
MLLIDCLSIYPTTEMRLTTQAGTRQQFSDPAIAVALVPCRQLG